MTDREKLIELLADMNCNAESCKDCEFEKDIDGCVRRQIEILTDHLIANGVTVQSDKDINVPSKWISVKDRLPEVNETVIVGDYTDGFVCAVKHLGDGRWKSPDSVLCTEAFTHWMPLPEPPKGE